MNLDDIYALAKGHCRHPGQDATSFKCSSKEVAAFAMGVSTIDAYADFHDDVRPWSQILQVGRVMQLFHDAPGPISIALAMATTDKLVTTPYQRKNLVQGFGFVMSDYSYKIFKRWADEGIEDSTTRTYHVVKNIVALGRLLAILETPRTSVDLESIQYQIGYANMALFPMCNNDVDAHPVAKDILERFIEEVKRHITPEVKDAA